VISKLIARVTAVFVLLFSPPRPRRRIRPYHGGGASPNVRAFHCSPANHKSLHSPFGASPGSTIKLSFFHNALSPLRHPYRCVSFFSDVDGLESLARSSPAHSPPTQVLLASFSPCSCAHICSTSFPALYGRVLSPTVFV